MGRIKIFSAMSGIGRKDGYVTPRQSFIIVGPNGKRRLSNLGILSIVAVTFLIICILGLLSWKNNQIALRTYNGDGLSILVPESYKETDDGGQIYFVENDVSTSPQSAVGFGVERFGEDLTKEQFIGLQSIYDEEFVKDALTNFGKTNNKITNVAITTATAEEELLYSGTADIEQEGKIVGKMRFKLAFNLSGYEYVIVSSYDNQGLENAAQEIINSFVNTGKLANEDYPEDFED